MNLVPEHINEAIKHMPGMSVDDFWKSLTKLNGKEIAEALRERLDMWPEEVLNSLLSFAPEDKMPFRDILDIIEDLRFATMKDRLRNIQRQISVIELYARIFDSLEAEEKDNALELLRMHTDQE